MLEGHTSSVSCVRVLHDGRILSFSNDATLRVWGVATDARTRMIEGHSEEVLCLCVLPDGRIVSGSEDKTLRVWNGDTGMCEFVLKGHEWHVSSVCAMPDGRIVSSGGYDQMVHVWDATTGKCIHTVHYDDGGRLSRGRSKQENEYCSACIGTLNSSKSAASAAITVASTVSLSSTNAFVCESNIVRTCIAPSGLVFVFCRSGRLHVLRQVPIASI